MLVMRPCGTVLRRIAACSMTGRLVVVDESASSGEETEIFGALHLLADIDIAGGTHCVASRFGLYAARASSTASTICT